jgi:hypothetical protein
MASTARGTALPARAALVCVRCKPQSVSGKLEVESGGTVGHLSGVTQLLLMLQFSPLCLAMHYRHRARREAM